MFMTYRAVGSSTGQKEFMGRIGAGPGTFEPLNDFGAGDIPMSEDRYNNVTANGREMVHIPFVMGAIAMFHSVPASDYAPATAIDLTPCLLARIFSGDITTWDHADIKAINPTLNVPAGQTIMVTRRNKGSSSTSGTAEYLNKTCPASWTLEVKSKISNWPAQFNVAEGSGGMSSYITSTPYALGYIDAGHGHNLGLSEIALLNNNNVYLTSKEADISSTVNALSTFPFPADSSSDFSHVNLYDLAGAQSWPITMVTYLYVSLSLSLSFLLLKGINSPLPHNRYLQKDMSSMNADTAAGLRAFVDYILSDEGQTLAETYAFVKIPQNVQDYNAQTLSNITWPSTYTQFKFETSTMIWDGADENVISVKRRSNAEYQRSNIETDITTLQADMVTVKSATTTNAAAVESCGHTDDSKNIAAAAIALSIISLLVSVVAICLGTRQNNKSNGMDKCTPSIAKGGHVEMGTGGNTI